MIIQANTGPEIVTGSTRMKAGTATKLIVNMISTTTMIKLGKVYGNLMIDLKTVNKKLIDRGTRIISEITGLEYNRAHERLISAENSVKSAIVMEKFKCNLEEAKAMLKNVDGFLHRLVKNNEKTTSFNKINHSKKNLLNETFERVTVLFINILKYMNLVAFEMTYIKNSIN